MEPRGTGRHCGAGATKYSAYPPPATSAQIGLPGGPPGDAVADTVNGTGDFEPQNVGGSRRRRIPAAALQHVGTIDARGRHLDQDFARNRLRLRTLDRHEHVGFTGFPNSIASMVITECG